jgi:hypothetical protein
MRTQLNFCFKGNRTYVQGPDIVSAFFKHYSSARLVDLDLKFNGITSTNLDLIEGDSEDNAKVNIRVTLDGEQKSMQLIENGMPIECRYDYDEDKIIIACEIDDQNQQVQLIQKTGYTLCENFVAMNKYLLQQLFPNEQGKWYFTRLEQKYAVPNEALITVKLIKNFNFRLTKSNILVGDELIGSVYFTMVRS